MKRLFRKTVLVALVAVLGLAALPFLRVSAAGAHDASQPQGKISDERMGHVDEFVENAQTLIDRAREKGKDVAAVQAALESFESALKQAQPIYESLTAIVNS